MNKYPKISIITPVFNAQNTIAQTINSVLSQNYSNLEYIIVDGKSTDDTLKIIEQLKDERTIVISEKDKGIYDAMNKGILKSTGEIIGIINADDYYLPNVLTKVAQTYLKTNAEIVYGNLKKIKEINNQIFEKDLTPDLSLMPKEMGIFHPSTFVKKSVYETIGIFNTKYKLAADYDFLLRAYMAKIKFVYLNEILTAFRVGGASNLSCLSYKESVEILSSHKSPFVEDMKKLYRKCILKKELKRMMNSMVNTFKLDVVKMQYLKRKWNK
jgi:glycosyltransferase involved in cell wall biosynthesis